METLKSSDGTLIHYDGVTAMVEKPKKTGVLWKPNDGQSFGCLIGDGIDFDYYYEEEYRDIYDRQQLFHTRNETEAADKKRIAEMKVKRWIAEKNEGWVPDWCGCSNVNKYTIEWSAHHNSFDSYYTRVYKVRDNAYYMRSNEIAEQLLKELPEECMLVFGPEA